MEALPTFGLVSTILGTASGAQSVGPLSAIAVGGHTSLAGLWSSPATPRTPDPSGVEVPPPNGTKVPGERRAPNVSLGCRRQTQMTDAPDSA
jgi:hypothetical protein